MKVEDSLMTILHQIKSVSKPMRRFLLALTRALLCVRGRGNLGNLARYASVCQHTLSRGFGRKFDFETFTRTFFDLFLARDTFIAALDATFITKSGKHTFGKDKFFSSTQGKAVSGLELSLLSLVSVSKGTAFSLSVRQSAAGLGDKLAFYLQQVQKASGFLLRKTTYLVADGFYAKHAFVEGVAATGLHLISRLRADADLRWLYQGQHKKRGRRRKYDGKVRWSEQQLWERLTFVEQLENGGRLYTALLYSMSLKRVVRVVVIGHKAGRCVLFSTCLTQDAYEVYRFYRLRFQIEFLFRDAKTHLGLGHCQSRQAHKLDFHFNFVFLLLNLIKYELVSSGKSVLSVGDLKTAYFNRIWLENIFVRLEIDTELVKKHPNYPSLLHWGSIAA